MPASRAKAGEYHILFYRVCSSLSAIYYNGIEAQDVRNFLPQNSAQMFGQIGKAAL